MDIGQLTFTRGRINLTLAATRMGSDLCVALYGGDRPHVGVVALAWPHPALHRPGEASATASVLTLAGHREDALAKEAALMLARRLRVAVSLTCGVHLDDITPQEMVLCHEGALELAEHLARLLEIEPA